MSQPYASPERATPLLSLFGLTKRYGAATVVDQINLDVAKGEFVCLLGPSGCGKTTTLQMIAGFVDASAGEIQLAGRDLALVPAHHRGLGVVFQSYALFPHMTVAENVGFGLEMRRIPSPDRDPRIAAALDLVRLGGFGDRYPRQLSGGQQQRVAVARALVIEPSMLLLDEPLSNLDAKLREEMQTELRRIHRSLGVTSIMVTHDQGEALALADRIAIMNHGRIEQVGSPIDIYDQPRNKFVASFLGRTNFLAGKVVAAVGSLARVEIAGRTYQVAATGCTQGERVTLSLRPEKLRFARQADGPLSGRVATCIFQGSTWFCEVETDVGPLLVEQPNLGPRPPAEGEPTALTFDDGDLRLLAEEQT